MSSHAPLVALAVAAAAHAGFQVAVTVLVYPPLLGDRHDWTQRHAAHSRRIVPLVGVTYGAVLLCCAWVLASGAVPAAAWVAVGAFAATVAVTAVGAAPRHGRLGRGFDPGVAMSLLRLDRWRCGLAVVVLTACRGVALDVSRCARPGRESGRSGEAADGAVLGDVDPLGVR